jgi:HK97 family phage major capsid protein
MSERLKRLREERGLIVTEMRGITEKAEAEKRDLSGEELAKHGELFGKADEKRKQIEAEERQLEVDRAAAGKDGEKKAEERKKDADAEDRAQKRPQASPEYRAAFRSFLLNGAAGLTGEEVRALSQGQGSQGGFTVAPEEFVNQLIKFVDDEVMVRAMATRFSITGVRTLGVPSLDTDPADADWTTELGTGGEDGSMAFGKRQMQPHPLAKRIKVSNDLLRSSAMDIESLVRMRLGYKFAVTQEKAYLTGNGASQPLGLFTASADGIPTGRDISAGNTATEIRFDGLIGAKFALKEQYRNRASWLFSRTAVEQIAKLKDGEGQYLWRMSTRDGEPDTILGRPYRTSEFAPATFTTGLYVGLIGDFSFYWIVDSLDFELRRLVELYAETNQTGYIGRAFTDGQPVLAEAFARVRLA